MKKQIHIKGMSCGNCVRHVKEALEEITGVENIQVNLQEKNAIVEVNGLVTDTDLKKAIEDTGYVVTGIVELNWAKGCESCG